MSVRSSEHDVVESRLTPARSSNGIVQTWPPVPPTIGRKSTPCRASWHGRKAPSQRCGLSFNQKSCVRDA